MSSDPDYQLEDQIGFKLRLANQRHIEVFTREMPEVTPTQFAVLAKLWESGTLSQNHLGRLVKVDVATTKGVVDRLLRKGLINITPSLKDRRRLEISLSEPGQTFTETALARAREISAKTVQNLTQKETATLLSLLEKL